MYKNFIKNLFFVIVFLFAIAFSSGKESVCDIISNNEIFLLDSSITSYREIVAKLINNELVILNGSDKQLSDFFEFNLFFPEKNKMVKIIISDSIWDSRYAIWDFEIINDYLFLLIGNSLLIFQLYDLNYHFIDEIKLLKKCYYLKIIDNQVIAYNSGNRSGTTDSVSSTYKININIKTFNQKIKHYKDPKGLKWVYIQPRKLIDIDSEYLAISDANRYFIRIENILINKTDTLIRIPIKWISLQNKKNINDSMKKMNFEGLMDEMSNISLIQRIHFLSNDKLMVVWTSPPENDDYYYELYFDLWGYNYELKKWDIINSDLKNCTENDSLFSISDLMISSFVLSGNSILSIHHIPYNVEPFIGKRKKDVTKTFEDYYRHHKPRYSIIRKEIR